MAIWGSRKIERASLEDRNAGWPEYEFSETSYSVVGEFESLEELIGHLKEATPDLHMEKDAKMQFDLLVNPGKGVVVFRCCMNDRPASFWHVAYSRLLCMCAYCKCNAPATQLDRYDNPKCDECEEIVFTAFEKFCRRQAENGKICPKCGEAISWDVLKSNKLLGVVESDRQFGTCGCDRRDWLRVITYEGSRPLLFVKERPVFGWEEAHPLERGVDSMPDQACRSQWPYSPSKCGTCGGIISTGAAYELVHFPKSRVVERKQGWYLCVFDNPNRSKMFEVGSREDGEILAERIEIWEITTSSFWVGFLSDSNM